MATNKKTEETAEEKTATLAEMQAQMAAMLAEAQAAKAEAQRMLEEAAKLTDGKVVSAERAARIEEDRLLITGNRAKARYHRAGEGFSSSPPS